MDAIAIDNTRLDRFVQGAMTARLAHRLGRLELGLTAIGLVLAGTGLLALLLCALGWRGAGQMPLDWALLALALAPATPRAQALVAPLFWLSGRAPAPPDGPRKTPCRALRRRPASTAGPAAAPAPPARAARARSA